MEARAALAAVKTYKDASQNVSNARLEVQHAEKACQEADKLEEAWLDLARKEEALKKAKLAREMARQQLLEILDGRNLEEIVDDDTYRSLGESSSSE